MNAMSGWAQRLVYETYVAAMVLFVPVLLLLPAHSALTERTNVTWVRPDAVGFTVQGRAPAVGDRLAVYRFNPDWRHPIGHGTVTEVAGDQVVMSYDNATFAWPMGIQGTVVEVLPGGLARLNVGSDIGLQEGADLRVYRDRVQVGLITVQRVDERGALAVIKRVAERAGGRDGRAPLVGAQASPYIIPNQVAWLTAPWLAGVERVVMGLALLWVFFRRVRGANEVALRALHRALRVLARGRLLWHALVGPPLIWLFLSVCVTAIAMHVPGGRGIMDQAFPIKAGGTALLGAAYLYGLFRTQRSPFVTLWDARVHLWSRSLTELVPGIDRRLVIWLLHLVIAWAFASTLTQILQANIRVAGSTGWAHLGLEFATWPDTVASLSAMLTHLPRMPSTEQGFIVARLILYSVTIVGCLVGYGHSVLSVLWGKHIRAVDFTVLGWVTNGLCYGALLGDPWAVTLGGWFGSDPGVADGPLYLYLLWMEFFLNLLYSVSIWNLWTMFGVMVDKGVRQTGFYDVVRHPNYALEACMFTAYMAPDMSRARFSLPAMGAMFLYWMRSERDDGFMGASNPVYVEYRKKVPWKFIPWIW